MSALLEYYKQVEEKIKIFKKFDSHKSSEERYASGHLIPTSVSLPVTELGLQM